MKSIGLVNVLLDMSEVTKYNIEEFIREGKLVTGLEIHHSGGSRGDLAPAPLSEKYL